LNRKAFLAGDTLVYVYSILALTVIAVVFSIVFALATPENKLKELLSREYTTEIVKPEIQVYDYINYYLNTNLKYEKKLVSLKELLPLYCYNQDENLKKYIQRITYNLLPKEIGVHTLCIDKNSKCEDLLGTSDSKGSRFIKSNNFFIQEGNLKNPKLITLYGFNKNICLEIESINILEDNFIEQTFSEKEFKNKIEAAENRVKETGLNKESPSTTLLSPKGDLWFFTRKDWCNINEDDCHKNKYISSEDLIKCNGDYEICSV